MKKYLLPEKGHYYKANLHCHTTISDGRYTPDEIKRDYKEKGYSVIAYTDHDMLIPHHDLTDNEFLALSAFEVEMQSQYPNVPTQKTCHICMIAKVPETEMQPCWNEKYAYIGNAEKHGYKVKFDESQPPFEREYSPECINEIMRICRENGFFVTYNHPTWSQESYPQYIKYNNMDAMEIYNHECAVLGYDEHNSRVYDDMLRGGKRIFCVATDDTHREKGRFGGFTMIKADKLEYRTITKALEMGSFYASEGPIINDLWVEDDKVHITFEPAREVFITKGIRKNARVCEEDGELREAVFDITKDDIYFRITVVGHDGKKAYTNAYFIDEI